MKALISRAGIARLKERIMKRFCRKPGSGDPELDDERDKNAERQKRFRDKWGRTCKYGNSGGKRAKRSAW